MLNIPLLIGLRFYVSNAGILEATQLLLKKVADINAQYGFYCSALQVAAYARHEMVVKLLLAGEGG